MSDVVSEMRVISSYSEGIKELISAGSWDDLNSILTERQQAIELFFSLLSSKEKTPDVIRLIEKLQAEDAAALYLLQVEKQGLEKQYLSLKQGRKSVKAYQY